MEYTYVNPYTRTKITVSASSSEEAWKDLCTRISPSDQAVYVLKENLIQHRKMDKVEFVLFLIAKSNNTHQCVRREVIHHKQKLHLHIFEYFQQMCLAIPPKENSEQKVLRYERAKAQVLYNIFNLN